MIKLFEDYKNLNMIDRSFLIPAHRSDTVSLQGMKVTPNSKVVINPIEPHKFSTIMDIYESQKDQIAMIIVRAHNRQLLAIYPYADGYTHEYADIATKMISYVNKQFFIQFTPFAYQKCKMSEWYSEWESTNSVATVKTIISRTVKRFYELVAPEGTTKKWDCIFVYNDPAVQQQRQNRRSSQINRVLTPSDPNYDRYISSLQDMFRTRAQKWIDDHRIDAKNAADIKKLLKGIKNDRIKFRGEIYNMTSRDMGRYPNFELVYRMNEDGNVDEKHPYCIIIELEFQGLKPTIKRIVGASSYWDKSDRQPI